MAGIGGLVSIYSSGIYESVRGLVCLHIANAVTGQVGTQTKLFVCRTRIVSLQPIGIHTLTRGVIGREIQIIKSVIFTCDLGTREDLKAHGTECIVQVIAHLCDGMKTADLGLKAGNRTVKILGNGGRLELYRLASALDLLGEEIFDVVDSLSHFRAKRNVKLRDLLEKLGNASLLSEKRSLYLLKLSLGLCGFDLRRPLFN